MTKFRKKVTAGQAALTTIAAIKHLRAWCHCQRKKAEERIRKSHCGLNRCQNRNRMFL